MANVGYAQKNKMGDTDYTYIIGLVTGIAALIGSIFAVIRSLMLAPREKRKLNNEADETEAKTADIYEDVLRKANERTNQVESRLLTRITELEAKLAQRDVDNAALTEKLKRVELEKIKLIDEMRAEIRERDKQIGQLRQWAERLVCQVKDLGGEPVPLDPPPGE